MVRNSKENGESVQKEDILHEYRIYNTVKQKKAAPFLHRTYKAFPILTKTKWFKIRRLFLCCKILFSRLRPGKL
jgi:hypothetical protein